MCQSKGRLVSSLPVSQSVVIAVPVSRLSLHFASFTIHSQLCALIN